MPRPPRISSATAFWTGVVLLVIGIIGQLWVQEMTFSPSDVGDMRFHVLKSILFQTALLLGVALIAGSLVLRHLEPAARAQRTDAAPDANKNLTF